MSHIQLCPQSLQGHPTRVHKGLTPQTNEETGKRIQDQVECAHANAFWVSFDLKEASTTTAKASLTTMMALVYVEITCLDWWTFGE